MRVNNTYVKSDIPARPKAPEKSQSSFGELLSSCAAADKNRDMVTISSRDSAVDSTDTKLNTSSAVSEPTVPVILSTDSVETKLAKLREIAEKADYTGMTGKEVFSAIWNRYNNAFGGNLAAMLHFGIMEWSITSSQFQDEYHKALRDIEKKEINELYGVQPGDPNYKSYVKSYHMDIRAAVLGYEGMSYEEREAEIIKKYRGKNTLLDYMNMQGELFFTGVVGNKIGHDAEMAYLREIRDCISQIYFPDAYYNGGSITDKDFSSVLNAKLNPVMFFNTMKENIGHCTFSGFNFDIKEVLFNCIDGFLDELER